LSVARRLPRRALGKREHIDAYPSDVDTGPSTVLPRVARDSREHCAMIGRLVVDRLVDRLDCCPWSTVSARAQAPRTSSRPPLYTPEERKRRDETRWTLVQGVLAPLQFVVFLVSLALVLRFLATGDGHSAAAASVVVKTATLYAIMVTGAIWEKIVFGRYLFARAFFWEDVFSILVIALHTAYLAALFLGIGTQQDQMLIALAAYAAYAINATQFLLKLREARLGEQWPRAGSGVPGLAR
jgi:3-vinyl bacteriochlorophyllide hydratase